jgi:hypothetical protein
MENKNPFSLDSSQYLMLCSYLFHAADNEISLELEKLDNYILMEYGLKSGYDFGQKSQTLYKTGRPFFYCIGSSNWNRSVKKELNFLFNYSNIFMHQYKKISTYFSLLGCPEGCLHNIFDAVKRQPIDQPLGILLCNFTGSLYQTAFAFNLNSIVMLAGCSWNTKISLVI